MPQQRKLWERWRWWVESSNEEVESDVSDDENQDHQDTDEDYSSDVEMQSDEDFDSNIFDILDSF